MARPRKQSLTQRWEKFAADRLVGRTIVAISYMSDEEAQHMGWAHRPVVMQLDDGSLLWASADDEGNDAGALFGQSSTGESITYPLLREGDA